MQNLRRVRMYLELLSSFGFVADKKLDKEDRVKLILLGILYAIVVIGMLSVMEGAGFFMCIIWGISIYFYYVGSILKQNPLINTIPVSKDYSVKAFFIYMPLIYVMPILLVITGVSFALQRVVNGGMAFYLQEIDLSVCIPLVFVCIACGFMCIGMAFRSSLSKCMLYILLVALVLGGFVYLAVRGIRSSGYTGIITWAYLLQQASKPVLWVVSASVMVISIVMNYLLAMCNSKRKIDKNITNASVVQRQSQNSMINDNIMTGKNNKMSNKEYHGLIASVSIGFVLTSLVLMVVVGLIITDGSRREKVDLSYENASEYNEWYEMDQHIKKRVPSGNYVDTIAFPKEVKEENVLYYRAGLFGRYYDEGPVFLGSSLHRILIQTLPQEEYEKEKARVAAIVMSYSGEEKVIPEENRILKDDKHFHGEAYIVYWNDLLEEYQYVVFDDATRKVGYVYGDNLSMNRYTSPCKSIMNVNPKAWESVISVGRVNGEYRDYSIYNFYDPEEEFYYQEYTESDVSDFDMRGYGEEEVEEQE